MRLRTTLVSLLLVLTVLLSVTMYAGFALQKDEMVSRERAALASTAESVAHDLDNRLESRRQLLEVTASARDVREHGSPQQRSMVASFVNQTDFDGATVVAPNGTVMAFSATGSNATERAEVLGTDLGDREYVRVALNGSTYASDPFRATSGNYVVVFSTPIRVDGRIVGTLNGAFHVTSADGDRSSLFDDLDHYTSSAESLTVRHENTSLYRSDELTGSTYRATVDLQESDWTVVVRQDESVIASMLRETTLLQVLGVFVVLAAFSTVGLWSYRTSIQQIAELREGLTALEDGEYDVTVSLSGTTEWDEIGQRFERVGNRLEQRESQLHVLNRVLRHNLRNDMNVVLGHAQSLLNENDEDEATGAGQRDSSDDVAYHASKIETAARGTLELSQHARLVENRLRAATRAGEPRSLSTVVDAATAADVVGTEATVTVDVPSDVAVVDGEAISTALSELVENAVSHNTRPSNERTVSITATVEDDTARIEIADNGPGLPETEKRLFTGETEPSPVDHGEGLGLWVARWLVERANGSLSATVSDAGTTICVIVPTANDSN